MIDERAESIATDKDGPADARSEISCTGDIPERAATRAPSIDAVPFSLSTGKTFVQSIRISVHNRPHVFGKFGRKVISPGLNSLKQSMFGLPPLAGDWAPADRTRLGDGRRSSTAGAQAEPDFGCRVERSECVGTTHAFVDRRRRGTDRLADRQCGAGIAECHRSRHTPDLEFGIGTDTDSGLGLRRSPVIRFRRPSFRPCPRPPHHRSSVRPQNHEPARRHPRARTRRP